MLLDAFRGDSLAPQKLEGFATNDAATKNKSIESFFSFKCKPFSIHQ